VVLWRPLSTSRTYYRPSSDLPYKSLGVWGRVRALTSAYRPLFLAMYKTAQLFFVRRGIMGSQRSHGLWVSNTVFRVSPPRPIPWVRPAWLGRFKSEGIFLVRKCLLLSPALSRRVHREKRQCSLDHRSVSGARILEVDDRCYATLNGRYRK
jgi:hypothetical protein